MLGEAWQLAREWQYAEPPQLRTVLPRAAVQAIACVGLFWGALSGSQPFPSFSLSALRRRWNKVLEFRELPSSEKLRSATLASLCGSGATDFYLTSE
eukprot:10832728-Alexandrium_andersonii.AAC.1